jgi:hypothetical protein
MLANRTRAVEGRAERTAIRDIDARARYVLDAHWQPEPGFTVPNAVAYPHQWLWDSCFHAVIWAHLGDGDRGVTELVSLFAHQGDDGFVPHLTYWSAPDCHAELWGRSWTSSVTQPPMYGHALAELHRRGVAVPTALVEAAAAGLAFVLRSRDRGAGRLAIVHPWESGCDDSPRWDAWFPPGTDRFTAKADFVRGLRSGPGGGTVASTAFEVASTAFAALVVFNVAELATVAPLGHELTMRAAAVSAALARSWDPGRRTFCDQALVGDQGPGSGGARVVEALLPLLVVPAPDGAAAELVDPAAFGGHYGPAQVHRAEPAYDSGRYWRGPAWPQLTYLLWLAARRQGLDRLAIALRDAAVRGALRSGGAEYWHPDTGAAGGAAPQSWTGLAAVMAAARS